MKNHRLPLVGLALLGAIAYAGLASWDPRSHGYEPVVGWFFATSDSSPQLVFAIVAALLFHRRRALRAALGRATAPGAAALCLVPAVVLHAWAQWVDAPDLMVVSLGLVGLGVGGLLGGAPLARLLAAPLAILLFALPLPGPLQNVLVYPYQLHTAAFVEHLLGVAGYTVSLQGDVLRVGARVFEVIETCSGLRSAQTLGLLASAWAVYFRVAPWHGALLLASSLPIAFVTNGIRVLVLVLDPRPEVQESHVTQGLLMFLVGTGALSLVDRGLLRLRRRAAERASRVAPAPDSPASATQRSGRLLASALALGVMASAALALPEVRPPPPRLAAPPELPARLRGWKVRPAPDTVHFLGSVYFAERSARVYQGRRREVTAFLGWDDRRLRTRSLLSEKNQLPGPGWEVAERGERWLEPGPVRMELVVARYFAERELVLYAYTRTESVFVEVLRSALALDQPGSPWARPGRAGFLRLSTKIGATGNGLERAEARLRAFYARLPAAVTERIRAGAGRGTSDPIAGAVEQSTGMPDR